MEQSVSDRKARQGLGCFEGLFISFTCSGIPVMSQGERGTPKIEVLETQVLLPV